MCEPHILILSDDTVLAGIYCNSSLVPPGAKLRFLSIVQTDRIPLHLILGTPCDVSTTEAPTSKWFDSILLAPPAQDLDAFKWWQEAQVDSPLGILVAVETSPALPDTTPRVTELLFYISTTAILERRPPTPLESSFADDRGTQHHPTRLCAVAFSSDLEPHKLGLSSPQSPSTAVDIEPVFLAATCRAPSEIIHEPPTKRRRTANDAFDEATERRKQERRKGGQRVSSAAPAAPASKLAPLRHRRSTSGSVGNVPLQARPLSRTGSVVSVDSRPGDAKTSSTSHERRSNLSHSTTSIDPSSRTGSLEQRNKDTISRVVMAGMRLYGLVQSRSRKSDCASRAPSPAPRDEENGARNEIRKNEEYKLVYHQVFKGVCFAFRAHLASIPLAQHPDATQDVVDKLLALYCNDPLISSCVVEAEEITPSGRKAFGSAQLQCKGSFSASTAGLRLQTPSKKEGSGTLI